MKFVLIVPLFETSEILRFELDSSVLVELHGEKDLFIYLFIYLFRERERGI